MEVVDSKLQNQTSRQKKTTLYFNFFPSLPSLLPSFLPPPKTALATKFMSCIFYFIYFPPFLDNSFNWFLHQACVVAANLGYNQPQCHAYRFQLNKGWQWLLCFLYIFTSIHGLLSLYSLVFQFDETFK